MPQVYFSRLFLRLAATLCIFGWATAAHPQSRGTSQPSPEVRLREFHDLARLISGQQGVLAKASADLAQANKSLAGPAPEQALEEVHVELGRVASEQAKKIPGAIAAAGGKSPAAQGKIGVQTTKNGIAVLSYSDAYWARVAAQQRAVSMKSRAERRVQTARQNLRAAYLALLLALPGLPLSAAPEVQSKLAELDAQSRKLGLGAIMSSSSRRDRPRGPSDKPRREPGDSWRDSRGGEPESKGPKDGKGPSEPKERSAPPGPSEPRQGPVDMGGPL
jgi:hypothetical protein